MDFLAFWMALGAMAISAIGMWYGSRQANAAESSARSARDAERRALKMERIMAYRWEIVPNGTDRYLAFNAGTRVAHDVRIDLPDFMTGVELRQAVVKPLERVQFEARVKPGFQSQVQIQLPRTAFIFWQDRDEKTPVNRTFKTNLVEYQPT
ncbi:hypothetical protein [Arthrobacter sp. HMWF013]|uniref:hypothetical protein n=1 Tax=Arthrobacter sp. HMWF013 TaxID=2056849 RepID=UPI000D33C619|nr:hypothetical protein [Arthrobacter sp. HMWF013]PTT69214.1 hypothetical protein DBR22_04390 [Arthrobacter sp. HMWF013]